MGDAEWVWRVLFIFLAISVLAYIVPGMILRAIRDFTRKYGKGEADVKKSNKT